MKVKMTNCCLLSLLKRGLRIGSGLLESLTTWMKNTWTTYSTRSESAIRLLDSKIRVETDEEPVYIVVTTSVFRDGRTWDFEVYIDVDDHAAFSDNRSLIAYCIQTLETSL